MLTQTFQILILNWEGILYLTHWEYNTMNHIYKFNINSDFISWYLSFITHYILNSFQGKDLSMLKKEREKKKAPLRVWLSG